MFQNYWRNIQNDVNYKQVQFTYETLYVKNRTHDD